MDLADDFCSFLIPLRQVILEEFLTCGGQLDAVLVRITFDSIHEDINIQVRTYTDLTGDTINPIGQRLLVFIHADGTECAERLRIQIYSQPKRPLDRHLPITERLVGEDLRLLSFLEVDEG